MSEPAREPVRPRAGPGDRGAARTGALAAGRLGIETFVRLLPLFYQEGVHAQWTAAAREIVRASDAETRGFAVRLAREVLALVDEAVAEGAGAAGDGHAATASGLEQRHRSKG